MKYILLIGIILSITSCKTTPNQDADFGNIYMDSRQIIIFPEHKNMNDDNPNSIFGQCEIMSCPQHIEAKKLANKYYNQLSNTSDKIAECALNITEENVGQMMKKLDGLETKFNKINTELINFLR